MAFIIRMGEPEMEAVWNDLCRRHARGELDRDEAKYFKKLVKTLAHLQENPRHPGLASHEIDDLSRRYKMPIFQSYLENDTPAAGGLFWAYGPDQGEITVLAVEPHPEDRKRGGYQRIKLSSRPTPKVPKSPEPEKKPRRRR